MEPGDGTYRRPFYIVAVHGGAGHHATCDDDGVKRVLSAACKSTLEKVGIGVHSVDAVDQVITLLEDDPLLNAGYGSNLTLDGTVECDAAIMDGHMGHFGSVGALSGILMTILGVKNPIKAAHTILQYSRIPDSLGRVSPLLLVSNGAHAFVTRRGVTSVPPGSLVSPRAQAQWEIWKSRLASGNGDSLPISNREDLSGQHIVQDTVGAIVFDVQSTLSSGVSSGGLLLKLPGRVGEAAVFGAGCWAQQYPKGPIRGTACSVSGTGEDIIKCSLARTVCETLVSTDLNSAHDVLESVLTEVFQDVCKSRGEGEPSAGILLLVDEECEDGSRIRRLWCAFTTQSMAVAYASSMNPKPKALILRRPRQTKQGKEGPSIYITALPW